MKAQDWPQDLATPTPLIGPQTALLPPINGVPWWYFDRRSGALGGERGVAADPGGELLAALPARAVIELGAFRTSMLQDYEAGRALELGGLVDAVIEIGARLGLATPMTEALGAFARRAATVRDRVT